MLEDFFFFLNLVVAVVLKEKLRRAAFQVGIYRKHQDT